MLERSFSIRKSDVPYYVPRIRGQKFLFAIRCGKLSLHVNVAPTESGHYMCVNEVLTLFITLRENL